MARVTGGWNIIVNMYHVITMNMIILSDYIIDYRATDVYGIRNERAPLIVLHWAALKRSARKD